jgi:hypothetical protein
LTEYPPKPIKRLPPIPHNLFWTKSKYPHNPSAMAGTPAPQHTPALGLRVIKCRRGRNATLSTTRCIAVSRALPALNPSFQIFLNFLVPVWLFSLLWWTPSCLLVYRYTSTHPRRCVPLYPLIPTLTISIACFVNIDFCDKSAS